MNYMVKMVSVIYHNHYMHPDRDKRLQKGEEYLRECAKAIISSPVGINRKKDIAFKAEIFSGLIFKKDIVNRVFAEVNNLIDIIKQSETYQMIIEEGLEEGRKRGLKEGLKEGIKEGIKEGKAQLIIKLLSKKLNGLPQQYRDKISEADDKVLDNIAEHIFEIDNLQTLNEYLK